MVTCSCIICANRSEPPGTFDRRFVEQLHIIRVTICTAFLWHNWTTNVGNLLIFLFLYTAVCFFLPWACWVCVCLCLIFNRSVDEKIPPGLIGSSWPHDQPTRKCCRLIPHCLIIWLIILESSDWCTYLWVGVCVHMCVCACWSFICKSLKADETHLEVIK